MPRYKGGKRIEREMRGGKRKREKRRRNTPTANKH